jgi:hypothetical protein
MEQGEGIATAFAVDVGIQYKLSDRFQFGAAITNVGPNISYIDAAQSDPLPRNIAIGLAYKLWDSRYNKLVVQGELNRMLVGYENFGHGIETAIRHIGAEYWYSNLIALRGG